MAIKGIAVSADRIHTTQNRERSFRILCFVLKFDFIFIAIYILECLIIILPIMFMVAVIKKSINPIAIREDKRNPSASPNWFAMIEAIEFPVEVIESGIAFVFPINIVTVMVSPNALPIAKM